MGGGEVSSGEWVFFVTVLVIVTTLCAVLVVVGKRHRNASTGLRHVIRVKRLRGPLTRRR
jgi:hypothetical protein